MAKNKRDINDSVLLPRTPKMSERDIQAMSKLAPGGQGIMPSGLVLCDVCGAPIAGSSDSTAAVVDEMIAGRHFKCHSRVVNIQLDAARRKGLADGSIPAWENIDLSDEEKAEAFNNDDTAFSSVGKSLDTTPAKQTQFFVPPKGSIPLSKVQDAGGLSAFDPKNIPATSNLPDQIQQMKNAAAEVDERMKAIYANGDPGLITQDLNDELPNQ